MNVLQLYYTSCPKGMSAGSGFQTYSMSEGITPEERKEIEKIGVYKPHDTLPSQPTAEEIRSIFPVAFSFFQLTSGRYGVCQTRYVGKDYSGRFGNYFCHALLLEQGDWPFYPIQLYQSPVFKSELTAEEIDVSSSPAPLPTLKASDVPLNPYMNHEAAADCISEEKTGVFKAILASIMNYSTVRKPIILIADAEEAVLWLTAVQFAFPLKIAHSITFTTHTLSYYEHNCVIRSIPKDIRDIFDDNPQRYMDFIVFGDDGSENRNDAPSFCFPDIVEIGYTMSLDNLLMFHRFLDQFIHVPLSRAIDDAFDLYQVINAEKDACSTEELVRSIHFGVGYASEKLSKEIVEGLFRVMHNLMQCIDHETAVRLTKQLFDISVPDQKYASTKYAIEFFIQYQNKLIDRGVEKSVVFQYQAILGQYPGQQQNLLKFFLQKRFLDNVKHNLAETDIVPKKELYFLCFIQNLAMLDFDWEMIGNTPDLNDFFVDCIDRIQKAHNGRSWVSEFIGDNKDIFGFFMSCLIDNKPLIKDGDVLLSEVIGIVVNGNKGWTEAIRKRMIEAGNTDYLFFEFDQLLKNADNKVELFWSYCNKMFSSSRKFFKNHFETFVDIYYPHIPADKLQAECFKIFNNIKLIRSTEITKKLIVGIESGIRIDNGVPEDISRYAPVFNVKKKMNIHTQPDMLGLLAFMISLDGIRPSAGGKDELMNLDFPDLHGMEGSLYYQLLKTVLTKLFQFPLDPEDFHPIFKYLCLEGTRYEGRFKHHFVEILMKEFKKNERIVLSCFIYLFFIMPNHSFDYNTDALRGLILKDIQKHLQKYVKKSKIKKMYTSLIKYDLPENQTVSTECEFFFKSLL